MNFNGECSEVGMYLAMARVAIREGYPEIGEFYKQAAWEEAEASAALTAGALGNLERTNEPQTGHALGPASSSERSHASNT